MLRDPLVLPRAQQGEGTCELLQQTTGPHKHNIPEIFSWGTYLLCIRARDVYICVFQTPEGLLTRWAPAFLRKGEIA